MLMTDVMRMSDYAGRRAIRCRLKSSLSSQKIASWSTWAAMMRLMITDRDYKYERDESGI